MFKLIVFISILLSSTYLICKGQTDSFMHQRLWISNHFSFEYIYDLDLSEGYSIGEQTIDRHLALNWRSDSNLMIFYSIRPDTTILYRWILNEVGDSLILTNKSNENIEPFFIKKFEDKISLERTIKDSFKQQISFVPTPDSILRYFNDEKTKNKLKQNHWHFSHDYSEVDGYMKLLEDGEIWFSYDSNEFIDTTTFNKGRWGFLPIYDIKVMFIWIDDDINYLFFDEISDESIEGLLWTSQGLHKFSLTKIG